MPSPFFQTDFPINLTQDQLLYLVLGAAAIVLLLGLGAIAGYILGQRAASKRRPPRAQTVPRPAAATASAATQRSERERLRTIYNLTSTLNASLNYQRVLEAALDLSTSALARPNQPTNPLVSAVLLFDNEQLHIRSARRFTHSDQRAVFPGLAGLLGQTINGGEPRLATDPSNDPELSRVIGLKGCRTAYCIPLRSGLDVYGVLLFAHPELDFFSGENRELLDIIASQAMTAMQNARLYQDLELEKERMAETQEEARKKLARDLHDGPTQSVAAIAMRLNFTRRLLERDPKEAAEEIFKIEELARRTTKEIRHMLFTLRPLVLESQGFEAALKTMAEKLNETYNQNVIIEVDPAVVAQLDVSKQGVIFFIAEEAINNARKHAQAQHIWVRLKSAGKDMARFEIQDDGVGFDVNAVEATYDSRGSLGMINLRERTELVNGVLQIQSAPGKGTFIQVWLPLTEEAIDRIRHS